MEKSDCVYPECQIETRPGHPWCEHTCPYEQWMKENWEPKETGDAWTGGFADNH